MARTESTMLELGTPAPNFKLPDPRSGGEVELAEFAGRPLLVAFPCNHCPFVKHIQGGLAEFARDYAERGLAMVAISANDVEHYPDDAPELMAREAEQAGYVFPYLYDETQAVAKAYRAACTPDFFLFDAQGRLAYRGQFDGARPGNEVAVSGADMRAAADAVLAGQAVAGEQRPSLGCNIKWKPGMAPDYFG
jgi:peroxiredoxin